MSEPISNSEIEDVLSSIRRLVSDDPIIRHPHDKPAAARAEVERLVLTPAFRVDDSQDDAPAEDLTHDTGTAPFSLAPDLEPEDTAEAAPMIEAQPEPEPEPELLAFRHVDDRAKEPEADSIAEAPASPPALPDGFEATDAWSDDSLKLHKPEDAAQAEPPAEDPQPEDVAVDLDAVLNDAAQDAPADLPEPLPPLTEAPDPLASAGNRPAALSLEDRIAELEAAIGHQSTQDWEPDGSEDGSDDETRPLSADIAEIEDAEADLAPPSDVSPYPLEPVDGDWAEPTGATDTADAAPEADTFEHPEPTTDVEEEEILQLASAIAAATSVETRKAERADQPDLPTADQADAPPQEQTEDVSPEEAFDDSAIADLMEITDPIEEPEADPETIPDANVIDLEPKTTDAPSPVEAVAEDPLPEPDTETEPDQATQQDLAREAVAPEEVAEAWNEMGAASKAVDETLKIVSPAAAPDVEWRDFSAHDEIAAGVAIADSADEAFAEDEDDFFDADDDGGSDSILDEDALRELISTMIREELQGVLGERITRNVRRLVRREIQRALAVRDLE